MKKQYQQPSAEIYDLLMLDVLTTSGGSDRVDEVDGVGIGWSNEWNS